MKPYTEKLIIYDVLQNEIDQFEVSPLDTISLDGQGLQFGVTYILQIGQAKTTLNLTGTLILMKCADTFSTHISLN